MMFRILSLALAMVAYAPSTKQITKPIDIKLGESVIAQSCPASDGDFEDDTCPKRQRRGSGRRC